MLILVADPDVTRATQLQQALRAVTPSLRVDRIESLEQLVTWSDDPSLRAVITERSLKDSDAHGVLLLLSTRAPKVAVAVLTSEGSEQYASSLTALYPCGYFTRSQPFDSLFEWVTRQLPPEFGRATVRTPQSIRTETRHYSVQVDGAGRIHAVTRLASVEETTGRLRQELERKDNLLREVHHRVKNNMQVISSMLGIQLRTLDHPDVRRVLEDNQRRIQAMALVHELLYTSSRTESLDARTYFSQLVHGLVMQHAGSRAAIRVNVECRIASLLSDRAVYLGLIVTELVSNAVRHAFGGTTQRISPPEIQVMITPTEVDPDGFVLTVQDNGVGIGAAIDPHTVGTLGLRIVANLARQLGADVSLERANGTLIRIQTRSISK